MGESFYRLVEQNRVEEVKQRLEAGFNTYQGLDWRHDTYLIMAVKKNFLEMARLLVKAKGCVIGAKSKGYNALHHAVSNLNLAMVELLLQEGAYKCELYNDPHVLQLVIETEDAEIAIAVLKYASQRDIYVYFNTRCFRRFVFAGNFAMVDVVLVITRIGCRYYDYPYLSVCAQHNPRMCKVLDIACHIHDNLFEIAEQQLRVGKIAKRIGMAKKRKDYKVK